jgi:hypothetical protein
LILRFWMMTLLLPLMLMPPLMVTFVPTPTNVLLDGGLGDALDPDASRRHLRDSRGEA